MNQLAQLVLLVHTALKSANHLARNALLELTTPKQVKRHAYNVLLERTTLEQVKHLARNALLERTTPKQVKRHAPIVTMANTTKILGPAQRVHALNVKLENMTR